MYGFFKRICDIALSVCAFLILSIPIMLTAILVRLTSKGPALYWSDRVGKGNIIFKMPKFRSMKVDTPAVATHLLDDPDQYLTPIGNFLRKSSLDELPQLWNIIKGDISFVGPRPALYNQGGLIALRTAKAREKLGWIPKYDLPALVKEMMESDVNLMKKDVYLKEGGFAIKSYYE